MSGESKECTDACHNDFRIERRRHNIVECAQAETIKHQDIMIEQLKAQHALHVELAKQTNTMVNTLHKKLFESNGEDALIPDIRHRLKQLEDSVVPHEKVQEIINAYDVGKTTIIAFTGIALLGLLGIWFWHLFSLNVPVPPKVIP